MPRLKQKKRQSPSMKRKQPSEKEFIRSVYLSGGDFRDVLMSRKKDKNKKQAYVILLTEFANLGVPRSLRTSLRRAFSDILREMTKRKAGTPHEIWDLDNNAIHINDTPLSFLFSDKFSNISHLNDCLSQSLPRLSPVLIDLIRMYIDTTNLASIKTCSLHTDINSALDRSIRRYAQGGRLIVTMATSREGLFRINPNLSPIQLRFAGGETKTISANFISKHVVDDYADCEELYNDDDDDRYWLRCQLLLHAGVRLELKIDDTTVNFPIYGAFGKFLRETPSTSKIFQNALDRYARDSQPGPPVTCPTNPLSIADSTGAWKTVLRADQVLSAQITFVVSICDVTLQKPAGDMLFIDHLSHEIAHSMINACFIRRYCVEGGTAMLEKKRVLGARTRTRLLHTREIFQSTFNEVVAQMRHMHVTDLNINISHSVASQRINIKIREHGELSEFMNIPMADIENFISDFDIYYI